MPTSHDLLRNAVIMDTETTGLARGSGIHELAIFDIDKQQVYEYLLKPQLVAVDVTNPQEMTRLATSATDVHQIVQGIDSWTDLMTAQTTMETGVQHANFDATMSSLKWSNPFLHKALTENKYPHLLGGADSPQQLRAREKALSDFGGVRAKLGQKAAVEDVIRPGSAIMSKLRGKTIWIANANFESKQLGAQISGMVEAAQDQNAQKELTTMQRMMETHNPSIKDPMYVTGVEVNKARAMAQQTGDWSQVWKAYLAHPPKAGETAVRDIQDVTKAFMSYGRKLGLLESDDVNFGTGIDLSYKLFGSLDQDPKKAREMLAFDEVHRAAEDAAISEHFVLKKGLKYTSALQEVHEGTTRGQQLIAQAARGQGLLAEASQYFARLQMLKGDIQQENLVKRVARAQEDIIRQGYTAQITGTRGSQIMDQLDVHGSPVKVPRTQYSRNVFHNMEDVISFVDQQENYKQAKSSAVELWQSMQKHVSTASNQREALSQWVDENTSTVFEGRKMGLVAAKMRAEQDMLMSTSNRQLGKLVTRQTGRGAKEALFSAMEHLSTYKGKVGAGIAAGALAITATGASWSLVNGTQQRPNQGRSSAISFNYQEWKEHQENFYGLKQQKYNDGMQEQGVSASRRSTRTDFGSPYRGPLASQMVLMDQELLAEREKYLREQYGARHYDPESGVFGLFGAFKSLNAFGRAGYSYIQEGTAVRYDNYKGLRGNLMALNLSDGRWKIDVDDADTITLKRGGVRGSLASMFGLNRGYSFRMAGIDSTETSHGSTSYHAPQPHAEAAAEAFRSLIKGSKNLELVYDPKNTTYGRMMGAVIADGKNLNFEVVRRGIAAHLPYGKRSDSMIDYSALGKLESQAYQAKRGLWAHPWARSFYDFSEASGNRMTFNSLAKKERIVQKTTVMSQLSMMEQAEAQGFYGTADRMAAAQLGKSYDIGSDKVTPSLHHVRNAPHNNYMDRMLRETAGFIKTKGTGRINDKYSRRGGYGKLDSYLSLDTMNTTNAVWNRRKLEAFDSYGTTKISRRARKQRQMAEQRRVNQEFGMSHVNHHRM